MSLFSKKRKINSPGFMLRTDIHSHILPGIDDGAENIDESISMLKAFAEQGFTKVIATPHVASERYNNTPEIIKAAYQELIKAAENEDINISIEYAAEYLADNSFPDLIKEGNLLSFGQNYILMEFSFFFPPPTPEIFAVKLKKSGYIPVLAHPERYEYWSGKLSVFEDLRKAGFLFQSNLNSAAGNYGFSAKKSFKLLSDNRMIDFLGTDAHFQADVNKSAKALNLKTVQQINTNYLLNHHL